VRGTTLSKAKIIQEKSYLCIKLHSMSAYAIYLQDVEKERLEQLLNWVRSHDFVQAIEPLHYSDLMENQALESNVILSKTEIVAIYPNQWVLVGNVQKENGQLVSGAVILHHTDKRIFALLAKSFVQKDKSLTHFYTGKLSNNLEHTGLAKRISK
jgi:hypothetical protein